MQKSINIRITLVMLATMLVPIVSITIFWGFKYSNVELESNYMNQYMLNQSNSTQVKNFLDSRFNSLTALSFEFSKNPHLDQNIISQIKEQLSYDTYINQIGITDATGMDIFLVDSNMNPLSLKNEYNTEYFKKTNQNNVNTYAGSIQYINGSPSVTLAVPIESTPNSLALTDHLNNFSRSNLTKSTPIGVMYYTVNLQSLLKSILNPTFSTNTNMNMGGLTNLSGSPIKNQYSYIVNPSGNVIASYDPNMLGRDLSNLGIVKKYMNSVKNLSNNNYTSEMNSYSAYFNNYKGVNSFSSYSTITGYGQWGVITETPKSAIYSPVTRFILFNTLFAFISAVSVILIAFFTSRLVVTPIKTALSAMDRIGNGDFDVDLNTKRKDEMGMLNESIVNTAQSLKTLLTTTSEQSTELQAIIDNSISPIISLDNSGGILISNKPAKDLLELDNNLIHNKKLEELLDLHVGNVKTNLKLDELAYGKYTLDNQIYISPTNQKHVLDITITKLPKSDLAITRYIFNLTDKTKSVELDEMKLDFVSMAAHELRTPLTAIQGYLELMMFGDNSKDYNDNTKRYIDQAKVSSKELSELITKLLNVSRIEHGNFKLNWDKVDIAARVKEAVDSLQFSAKEKKVSLSMKGNTENEFVVADRYSIQEVLDNLIDNAIKYNRENGEVNVSLDDDGSNYIIKVSDTGIGVPKNALPYLFTKFYRVHGGLESGSTGTGLGLYLAKQIIESHRGSITVDSEVNKGTVFTIILPHYSDTLMKTLNGNNTNNMKDSNRAWNTKNINR